MILFIYIYIYFSGNDNCPEQVEEECSSKPKRAKRGKKTNAQKERDWTDEETFQLIELWSNHECLYNTKSPDYMIKDKRSQALNKIAEGFSGVDNPPTPAMIQLKITRLRNYYGGENNKVEKSKTSGGDLESVYVPTWKFFARLDFLKDNLLVRPTKTNLNLPNESSQSLYYTSNPPSAKSLKKMENAGKSTAEEVMKTATEVLKTLSSRYDDNKPKENINDEDRNFVEMIYGMLKSIPNGMNKDMLKLEFQQKIIQMKYNSSSRLNSPTSFQSGYGYHMSLGQQMPIFHNNNSNIQSPGNTSSSSVSSPYHSF